MECIKSEKRSARSSTRDNAALQDREAYYRSLLSNIADVVVVLEPSAAIRDCSPSVTRHLGWDPADLIGTNGLSLIHPEDRPRVAKALANVLKEPQTEVAEFCRVRRADGTYTRVEISGVNLVADPRVRGVVANVRACSPSPDAPTRLPDTQPSDEEDSDPLEIMAGGIAHDLNNILAGLVSYPELILLELPVDSALREPIEAVLESGQRAAAMVADLVTLGKGVSSEPEPIDIGELVTTVLTSPEFAVLVETHPLATYSQSLADGLPLVEAPRRALAQAVLTLIANAFGGTRQGGHVTIATARHTLQATPRGFETAAPGEYVAVSISDTGAALSSRDKERILEPFYAKRVLGRGGYGLGMALARITARAARGAIAIRSDTNGTTLDFCLPPCEG